MKFKRNWNETKIVLKWFWTNSERLSWWCTWHNQPISALLWESFQDHFTKVSFLFHFRSISNVSVALTATWRLKPRSQGKWDWNETEIKYIRRETHFSWNDSERSALIGRLLLRDIYVTMATFQHNFWLILKKNLFCFSFISIASTVSDKAQNTVLNPARHCVTIMTLLSQSWSQVGSARGSGRVGARLWSSSAGRVWPAV